MRRVALRRLKLSAGIRGSHIRLDASKVSDKGPIWIQVAAAGEYKGYKDGPVSFDAAFFNKVIANFHAHPWYVAGEDGIGTADVVPYDYEHASEMDPTQGSIPKGGAPAPAWAQELQCRTGEDGTAQLWALTRPVNDEVRQMLREGGYKSTSVAVWRNAVDSLTAQKLGPVLTSIAFTNHPFIQGMEQIAARVEVWGEAESPEELIVGLRDIFELDENAPPQDIMVQIAALGAAFANGVLVPAYPEGCAPLLDRVRRLISLPALSTAQQIIEGAGQLLGAMPTSQQPPTPTTENSNMALDPKRLIAIFKIKNPADEETAILMAAEQGAQATDAISQLQTLFGSEDFKSMMAAATDAVNQAEKVKPLMDALTAANAKIAEQDKESAANDVEEVAASLGFNKATRERMTPGLLLARTEAGKTVETLSAWRKQYGIDGTKPAERQARQLLTRASVAGPNGAQLGNPQTLVNEGGDDTHPLEGYGGRNRTEKAQAYLCEKRPGFKSLDKSTQLFRAGQYLNKEGAPILA